MKKWIILVLTLTLVAFALTSLGCKTSDSTDDPEPSPTPNPTPTLYTGNWSGTTSQTLPITFTVDGNNAIKPVTIRIQIPCASMTTTWLISIQINSDGSFSWSGNGAIFSGKFNSATAASGSYSESGSSPCTYNVSMTWTATKL